MFLKEKRDSTIKATGCTEGRSQSEYTTKAETSSPTVYLEAMMMSYAIMVNHESMKRRYLQLIQ